MTEWLGQKAAIDAALSAQRAAVEALDERLKRIDRRTSVEGCVEAFLRSDEPLVLSVPVLEAALESVL